MKYVLFISFLINFSSLSGQKNQWEEMQKNPTIESVEAFITKYPDSKYSADARIKLEELYWSKTLQENTMNAYQTYLSKYPYGLNSKSANLKLELLTWEQAVTEHTVTSFENYLKKYPAGIKKDSVKIKITEIAFDAAITSESLPAYQDYLDTYWGGKPITGNEYNFKQLEEILYRLTLINRTINNCSYFLYYFPKSDYVVAVNEVLKSIVLETTDLKELRYVIEVQHDSIGILARNQLRKLLPAFERSVSSVEGEILIRLWRLGEPTDQQTLDYYKSLQVETNAIVAIPVGEGDVIYGEVFIIPYNKYNMITGFTMSDLMGDMHSISTSFNPKTYEFDFSIMYLDTQIKSGQAPVELTINGKAVDYPSIRFTINEVIKN